MSHVRTCGAVFSLFSLSVASRVASRFPPFPAGGSSFPKGPPYKRSEPEAVSSGGGYVVAEDQKTGRTRGGRRTRSLQGS